MNRGLHELFPNGSDVRSLGLELLSSGFDHAEANHNGMAVEEVPPEVRASPSFADPVKAAVAASGAQSKYEGIGPIQLSNVRGR